jgi:hypothetical protein
MKTKTQLLLEKKGWKVYTLTSGYKFATRGAVAHTAKNITLLAKKIIR